MKKVTLGVKPQPNKPATADEWVNNSASRTHESQSQEDVTSQAPNTENTPMKRLTIDVSESLHAQIKSACALKGVKMADEIRTLLETHFNTNNK